MRIVSFLVLLFASFPLFAQTDTLPAAAVTQPPKPAVRITTPKVKIDSSILPKLAADSAQAELKDSTPAVNHYDTAMAGLAKRNPLLSIKADHPYYDINPLHDVPDEDWLVYTVAGVLLLLGIIRAAYVKYFSDLFRAFFNPTLSQRQLKDQLSQSPFPNFLMNVYFVISMGLYLYLLMKRFDYPVEEKARILIPALIVLVAVVYFVKYIVLRFCGWLFGNAELIDAYVFVLYLINKILGILLVPFLVLLAFGKPELAMVMLYISLFCIVLLIVYRYIRSYSLVKQYLSFSRLHFFFTFAHSKLCRC
ncbi:DUF4271 domain-containing protein [Chitinophaga sedimenti]|uniref:DUF4271 domain-containing protein n=1 Tax=Chitinophaga sedimenti TaxID=2033606 RepID=UPI002004ECC5|nr:DUF4271 domain-containing protein [Chitinophaga sedimenti]MCK7558882.1 DUF4271 domain-containing protein [Chitinophaga sedimenti]